MTRATRFAGYSGVVTFAYALAWLKLFSIPLMADDVLDQLLPVIPWWLLVCAGSYSLASLGIGLYTFNDTPEAYDELMKEISEAKDDLRSKGVTVD